MTLLNRNTNDSILYSQRSSTIFQSLKIIITTSWINLLLVFIPFGYLAQGFKWGDTATFILNFFAIVPLAKLLGFATEDVSLRVGQTIGSLLNATFGNAVELIISIMALRDGQIRIVQELILGSVILVLGECFVAGGIFQAMTLACIGLIIPMAFNFTVNNTSSKELFNLSHGTAIILLTTYILYLYFRLKFHSHLYYEGQEEPKLSLGVSLFLIFAVTVGMVFSAKFLVSSIEGIVESSGLSKTFIGIVPLPILCNYVELVNAFTIAINSRNINVDTGNLVQIALPFICLLGWIIGLETTLTFQSLETVVLFISFLMANYLIQRHNLRKLQRKLWKRRF